MWPKSFSLLVLILALPDFQIPGLRIITQNKFHKVSKTLILCPILSLPKAPYFFLDPETKILRFVSLTDNSIFFFKMYFTIFLRKLEIISR